MGKTQQSAEVAYHEVTVWTSEGEFVERRWRATIEDADAIRGQYDDGQHVIVVELRETEAEFSSTQQHGARVARNRPAAAALPAR